jgi:hypothetical protein
LMEGYSDFQQPIGINSGAPVRQVGANMSNNYGL